MKILFITARFPYPPFKGDQAIPYYRLKHMGGKDEITLLTFYENKKELAYIDKIAPYCKEIVTVKKSFFKSLFNMLILGLFSKRPLQVLYYRSRPFKKQLEKLITGNTFDILHVYMLRTAGYGKDIRLPKILELIDSMQLNFQRRVEEEKWPWKLFFKMELKRLKRYESEMVGKYDRSIVVSGKDKEFIAHPGVVAINLGIDTREFSPRDGLSKDKVIAFTGNMGYFPNKNAILWFLRNCWQTVRQQVPDARLVAAGKNPGTGIKRYDDGDSVRVPGYVDSIAGILHNARVAIAPMQSGSGMQFKILEAMACGLPVVTTSLGLGTIPAVDNESVLIADKPMDFIQCCIQLLTDDALAENIGKKGMQLVRERFCWENNINNLCKLYDEVLGINNNEKKNN